MDDKLFLFLGRGSGLEGKGIKIQSGAAGEVWFVSVTCFVSDAIRPTLTTVMLREKRKCTKYYNIVTQSNDMILTNILV